MTAREWLAPLGLGLLVAGGLMFVHVAHPVAAPPSSPDVVLPFSEGRSAGGNLTFLVMAPHGTAAADAAFGPESPALVAWRNTRLGFCTLPPRAAVPALMPQVLDVGDPAAPRLGMGGYNATVATAYVFDSDGALLASNAPESEQARFTKGDFHELPGGAWYLGAGSAPNGTVDPPPLARAVLQRLLPQLIGLPEGGVASDTSNAFVAFYGTLFITVRVDHLVDAP